MNDGTRNAGLNDIAEQKKWLRATTHGLLTRFSRWRRRVKIGLVIGGGFIAGAAGVAANLLDPALKWQVYIFQIIGLALVFAGGVLMDFLDEGAADAIKRANELVDAAEERDEIISSLGRTSNGSLVSTRPQRLCAMWLKAWPHQDPVWRMIRSTVSPLCWTWSSPTRQFCSE